MRWTSTQGLPPRCPPASSHGVSKPSGPRKRKHGTSCSRISVTRTSLRRSGRCRQPLRNVRVSRAHARGSKQHGGTMHGWVSPSGSQPDRQEIDRQVQRLAEQFAQFADFMGDRLPRERLRIFEQWLDAGPLLLARAFNGPNRTIVHGDAHVWNCFLPRDERSDDVRLFDRDSWRIGLGAIDLAYMMAVHWYPDLRHEREQLLLDDYHTTLVAQGIAGYDRFALQTDYRLSVLWQLMTPVMQHAYGIPPLIWWNNLERILLAADDLNCRDLLG